MKLFKSKKLLGSLVLCEVASGGAFETDRNFDIVEKNSWQLDKINLEGVLNNPSNLPKKDIVVAVVDTGVTSEISQLNDKLIKGYNFLDDDSDTEDYEDRHGTLSAEIINMISKDSKIMPLKVADESGQVSYPDIAHAIDYAVSHGANIINLSMGSINEEYIVRETIVRAIENGCIVVASAGNDGISSVNYPGAYDDVVAVGAINKNNKRYSFSNYGKNLDIMAPGVVDSPSANREKNGTSYATPYVTGVLALLWQNAPELTGKEITNIALSSTRWLDNFNKDEYGNGLIDACLSYEKLISQQQGKKVDLKCDNYWYNPDKNSSSYKAMLGIGIGTVTITAVGVTLYIARDKFLNKNDNVEITDVTEVAIEKEEVKENVKHKEEEIELIIPDGDITEQSTDNINKEKSNQKVKKNKGIEI